MFKEKHFLAIAFTLSGLFATGQNIGIGTVTPDPSAALEIKNTSKGLLVPRVNLASANDNSTVPSPANSLLVFNTNAAMPNGVGYYFNNGSSASPSWKALNAGNFSLPYSATFSSASSLFSLSNNSTGYAAEFISNNTGSIAALKASTASTQLNSAAIHGISGSSGLSVIFKTGILGESNGTGIGVVGMSQAGDGVFGLANAQSRAGVHGRTDADFGYGVLGQSFGNGTGGYFSSDNGRALVTNGVIQFNNTGAAAGKMLMTDANGHAHWEGAIAFSARFDSVGGIEITSGITIPFSTEDFDIANNFNTRGALTFPNSFIVPVNGVYDINLEIRWTGTAGSNLWVKIFKNGAWTDDTHLGEMPEGVSSTIIRISRKLRLNAGDVISSNAGVIGTPVGQKITESYFSGSLLFRQ